MRFFEETSQFGDLYVVIGSDANVRLLKGEGHPLFLEQERLYMEKFFDSYDPDLPGRRDQNKFRHRIHANYAHLDIQHQNASLHLLDEHLARQVNWVKDAEDKRGDRAGNHREGILLPYHRPGY